MSQELTMAGMTPFSVTDALKPGAALLKWMVLVSLFSWARDKATKQNGWWASALLGRRNTFGSLLWRLERAKNTDLTATQAKGYITQALAWMKTDRVVDDVIVVVYREETRLVVDLLLLRGEETTPMRFSDLWEVVRGS